MKKMGYRTGLYLSLCILMMLGGLTGCGKQVHEKESSSTETEKEGTHEAITLVTNNIDYRGFAEALKQVYPEINIEFISYAGANGSYFAKQTLENGDIPDIYSSTRFFAPDAQREYLLDLSNYHFINNYSTHILNELDNEGGIYLLPSSYGLSGMYYNKTILEENGWTLPESFQELQALAPDIEAAGYEVCRSVMDLEGYPFVYYFSLADTAFFYTPEGARWKEDFLSGEAAAAGNSGLIAATEYVQKWIDAGFISPKDSNSDAGKTAFLNGECVFYLSLGLSSYETTDADGKTYELGAMPWLSDDGESNILVRSVNRYYGIRKGLEEKGNEQKLEDALHVLEFMSSEEGQKALFGGSFLVVTPLTNSEIPAENPYYEVRDLISQGRTVPEAYVGWEDYTIPMAAQIEALISGNLDTDGLLAAFDRIHETVEQGEREDQYATVPERMTLEMTARLCAIAEGKAVDADAALVSFGGYHDGEQNKFGVNWYLYPGIVDTQVVNMVKPKAASIAVLELTGAEIKEMAESGLDLQENGNPYPYLLVTKNDSELKGDTVYRLAVSIGELTEMQQKEAELTDITPGDAIIAYLKEIETVTDENLKWE